MFIAFAFVLWEAFAADLAFRVPAQRSTRSSMQPTFSSKFAEHVPVAPFAVSGTSKWLRFNNGMKLTYVELLKPPVSRNHGAILLLLFFLAHTEVNQRLPIGRFP